MNWHKGPSHLGQSCSKALPHVGQGLEALATIMYLLHVLQIANTSVLLASTTSAMGGGVRSGRAMDFPLFSPVILVVSSSSGLSLVLWMELLCPVVLLTK